MTLVKSVSSYSGDHDVILWIILKAISPRLYIFWMYMDTLSFHFLSCSYDTHIWTLWTNLTDIHWCMMNCGYQMRILFEQRFQFNIKNSWTRLLIICILWGERLPEFFSSKVLETAAWQFFLWSCKFRKSRNYTNYIITFRKRGSTVYVRKKVV